MAFELSIWKYEVAISRDGKFWAKRRLVVIIKSFVLNMVYLKCILKNQQEKAEKVEISDLESQLPFQDNAF